MTAMQAGSGAGLSGRKILVVEDEYFLADDLAQALTKAGAEVVGPFNDPGEALALLGSDRHQLHGAVLDINLHGTLVYPLAEALRAKNISFVFATGFDATAIPPEFGDVPRWEKPFDPAALARMLPLLDAASS